MLFISQFFILLIPLIWTKEVDANYVTPKRWFVHLAAALCLLVLSFRPFYFRQIPKVFSKLFLGYALFYLLIALLHPDLRSVQAIIRFSCFVSFVLFFLAYLPKISEYYIRYKFIVISAMLWILFWGYFDFIRIRLRDPNIEAGVALGSFGNVNMMAEFLVLSLPLVYLFLEKEVNKFRINFFLLSLWILLILQCQSRSAWIGLGGWLVYQIIFLKQKRIFWTALLSLAIFIATPYFWYGRSSPVEIKAGSTQQRSELYWTSLELIKDFPLGVGPGHFVTEISPYLALTPLKAPENMFVDHPHSEILKWFSELGWIGGGIPLLILSLIAFYIRKNHFLISLGLVVLPQILFQFPFDNPASMVLLAAYLGFFLFQYSREISVVQLKGISKFLLRSMSFILAGVGTCFFVSIYLSSNYPNDFKSNEFACQIYPLNMKACHAKNILALKAGDRTYVQQAFKRDIEGFPFGPSYMMFLPDYLQMKGEKQKVCESLIIYDSIFKDQKAFDDKIVSLCRQQVRNPLFFHDPKTIKESYLSWLKQAL